MQNVGTHIVVHKQFWHKLNYFLYFQIFEKIFFICVEILISIIKLNFDVFDYQVEFSSLPILVFENVFVWIDLECPAKACLLFFINITC